MDSATATEVSSLLDQRLKYIEDSIELRLSKALDKTQTDRAESFRKTMTWTVGIITVVVSLLGIKTVADLKETAQQTAVSEVRKKLNLDDPNSEVMQNINDLLAIQKINEILLRNAATSSRRDSFTNDAVSALTADDIKKIKDLFLRERTVDQDFQVAYQTLTDIARSDRDPSIDAILRNTVLANEVGFKHFKLQDNKRAIVLEGFKREGLQEESGAILKSQNSSERLVRAAIKYVVSITDFSAIPDLERLAASGKEKTADEALIAIAKIAPEAESVRRAALTLDWENERSIVKIMKVAAAVSLPVSKGFLFREEPKSKTELRAKFIAGVLEQAIDRGAVLRASTSFGSGRSKKYGLYLAMHYGQSGSYYDISPDILKGAGAVAIDRLIKKRANKPQDLWKTLKAVCLWDEGKCQGSLSADVGGRANIIAKPERNIGPVNGDRDIQLIPQGTGPAIDVRWTTGVGQVQAAPLDRILNISAVKFSVVPPTDFGGEDDDN